MLLPFFSKEPKDDHFVGTFFFDRPRLGQLYVHDARLNAEASHEPVDAACSRGGSQANWLSCDSWRSFFYFYFWKQFFEGELFGGSFFFFWMLLKDGSNGKIRSFLSIKGDIHLQPGMTCICLTEEVLAAWLGVKNAATTRCFWCRNGMILSEASLPVAMALNRSVIPERGLYIALAIIFLQIFLEPAWWKSSIMRETLDHQRMWREVNSLPSKVLSIWDLNDLFANVILPNFFEPNLSHSKELLRPTGNTRKANRIVWGCTEPLCWLTGDGAEPWKTLLGFFFGSNPSLEHQAEGSAVCSGFRSDQKSAPSLEDLCFLYFFLEDLIFGMQSGKSNQFLQLYTKWCEESMMCKREIRWRGC